MLRVSGLGRKQNLADPAAWRQAMDTAAKTITRTEIEDLVAATVVKIQAEADQGRSIGYGWSGGKDSQALRYVMEQAIGRPRCVLGMSSGLEWPAMLTWLTDHMPQACDVIALPLDLPWLAKNPKMLFPQGANGPKWFTLVQHKAQREFYRAHQLDLLALGRRRVDGNFCGRKGRDRYTNTQGITRWSPIADWTHEQVFALIAHMDLPLPPCYDWPRGFQVGTGAWPARQWTRDVDHGFEECWQIDPSVVRRASVVLPAALQWLGKRGLV